MNERAKDLKRRFDLIDEALDGLSNHDRFGLLGGMVGYILQQYMREERPLDTMEGEQLRTTPPAQNAEADTSGVA